jgi:hypothetical protein
MQDPLPSDPTGGWIALTTIVWAGALSLLLCLLLAAVTDVLATQARAQTAADAAALAAVGSSPLIGGDGEPESQARRLSQTNQATLERCSCLDLLEAEVTVSAAPRLRLVRLALPKVRAQARAELQAVE